MLDVTTLVRDIWKELPPSVIESCFIKVLLVSVCWVCLFVCELLGLFVCVSDAILNESWMLVSHV